MRVAVCGGSGFIGRHVCAALIEAGHRVRVLSRRAPAGHVEHVACDLTRDVPADAVRGCDAIVNLVGIKAGSTAAFRAAHVDVVRHLVAAARAEAIGRIVHVSVVDVPGSTTVYTQTKREGEALLAQADDLAVTILRPALVVGPGDDALTNTIATVRLVAVFPVPRPDPGRHAIVDVRDVAAAIVQALARPDIATGKTYDIVGPERLTMQALAQRVARVLALPTWCPVIPAAAMRPAAVLFEPLGARAPVTRSQLDMLVRGLDGDADPAARDLDLCPRPLADATIEAIAASTRGPSLRLLPTPAHRDRLAAFGRGAPRLAWFVALALAAMIGLPQVWPDVWSRMAVVEGALATIAVLACPAALRSIARPSWRMLGVGLLAAAMMIAVGIAGVAALRSLAPAFAAEADRVIAWGDALPFALALPAVVFVVSAEDIVWRATIGLPLCARYGPWVGSVGAGSLFAVAHVTSGPPILWLAALAAGTAWTALLVRTQSLFAVIVCHVTWDIAMLGALR